MSEETRSIDGGLSAPAKRGRPRKDAAGGGAVNGTEKPAGGKPEPVPGVEKLAGFEVVDPFDLPANQPVSRGSGPRKRGRPRGSRSAQKEEAAQNLNSLLKIEKILVSGAFFLGNIAACPELYMSEEQGQEIGEALRDIAKLYPIGMSEKAIAWVNLSFAVGGWAAPAAVAILKRPGRPRPQRVIDIDSQRNGSAPSEPVASPEGADTMVIDEQEIAD